MAQSFMTCARQVSNRDHAFCSVLDMPTAFLRQHWWGNPKLTAKSFTTRTVHNDPCVIDQRTPKHPRPPQQEPETSEQPIHCNHNVQSAVQSSVQPLISTTLCAKINLHPCLPNHLSLCRCACRRMDDKSPQEARQLPDTR